MGMNELLFTFLNALTILLLSQTAVLTALCNMIEVVVLNL
jgi:hypothetical protein